MAICQKYKVKSKDHPFGQQVGEQVRSEDRKGVKWITLNFGEPKFLVTYAEYHLEAV